MKISRNFTLVLFLGAIAVIFFGLVLMRDHKKADRVSSANQSLLFFRSQNGGVGVTQQNQPFFPFGSRQAPRSKKITKENLAMFQHFQDMQKRMPHVETPPYVPVASVDAPTGVAAAWPIDLIKKFELPVSFTVQYHTNISSKYSTAGYTLQMDGRYKPRPKEEAHTFKGFCARDGNNTTITEDDDKDNIHHVFSLKNEIAYERQAILHEDTYVRRLNNVMASCYSPNFELYSYPSFWISPHFSPSSRYRILKQNEKYIYTNVFCSTIETDNIIEIVDGMPRISSVVNRKKIVENGPWHVENKVLFSNFTKVERVWIPRSISITTYHVVIDSQTKETAVAVSQKQPRASLQGVTRTQITISSIKIGKPAPKYFDWRSYAANGESARNISTPNPNGDPFIINTSDPDLWAQANATQNKLGEYAKNPLLHRITFTKPFMAQYKQNSTSQVGIIRPGVRILHSVDHKTISTFSFDGKILLVRTDRYANNRLTNTIYSLTDPKNTVTLKIYSSISFTVNLDLHRNQDPEFFDHLQFPFLPYNFDWNYAKLSAPLGATPATLDVPGPYGFSQHYQVALDQGSPKVLEPRSDYKLIDNVWIPGQIEGNTELLYFKPVMPPAGDLDLLSVIKHHITEKNVQSDWFDIVGNTPEVKGIHKMTIDDSRDIDQRGVRQIRRRIIDLDGPPIFAQINSGQARPFDNVRDSKTNVEFFKANPRFFNHQNSPIFFHRNLAGKQ